MSDDILGPDGMPIRGRGEVARPIRMPPLRMGPRSRAKVPNMGPGPKMGGMPSQVPICRLVVIKKDGEVIGLVGESPIPMKVSVLDLDKGRPEGEEGEGLMKCPEGLEDMWTRVKEQVDTYEELKRKRRAGGDGEEGGEAGEG